MEQNRLQTRLQLNTRVAAGMRRRVKLSAALSDDISQDQIVEDALAMYFGMVTPDVKERRQNVLDRIKQLEKGKLPFECPDLQKDNASLSRGDSAGAAVVTGGAGNGIVGGGHHKNGAVAQLAERVNGIHKVTGSTPVSSTTPTKNKGKIVVIPLGPKEQSLAE